MTDAAAPLRRRDFLTHSAAAIGSAVGAAVGVAAFAGFSAPAIAVTNESPATRTPTLPPATVRDVIDAIERATPSKPPGTPTVDRVIVGDPDRPLTGIVTATFPTVDVIRRTAALGANCLLVHEPTFYTANDDSSFLQGDPVHRAKRELLARHGIVVWRDHDRIHAMRPDGVVLGIVDAMGWRAHHDPASPGLVDIPETPLVQLLDTAKRALGAAEVQYVGDPALACRRVLVSPGFDTFRSVQPKLVASGADVLLAGEMFQWEAAEYFRDAVALGARRALVLTGHAVNESPGMQWLVPWLRDLLRYDRITYVPTGDPFRRR